MISYLAESCFPYLTVGFAKIMIILSKLLISIVQPHYQPDLSRCRSNVICFRAIVKLFTVAGNAAKSNS